MRFFYIVTRSILFRGVKANSMLSESHWNCENDCQLVALGGTISGNLSRMVLDWAKQKNLGQKSFLHVIERIYENKNSLRLAYGTLHMCANFL